MTTEANGIFQADLLIRHALLQGIKELRANAWLQDYVLMWAKQDELTAGLYGQKEIEAFKKWFQNQKIAVITPGTLVPIKSPAVTIALVSSAEEDNTLADTHYVPQEDVPQAEAPWPDLTAKFTPTYTLADGTIVLPPDVASAIVVFPGMVIMDAQGTPHEIVSVENETTLKIEAGMPLDFRNATLRAGSPAYVQTLHSAKFKESYQIGCHVDGEPAQLIYLHSLVVFLLLWGREELLEGRGFEKSSFSSTDFTREQYFAVETEFNRYISLSGTVQHCWPARRLQKLTGVTPRLKVIGAGNLPPDMQPTKDQLWIGDKDSVG